MSWKRNSWTEQRCFRLLPGFTNLLLVLLTCVASTEDLSAFGAEHVWAVKVRGGEEGSQGELTAVADSTATDLGLVNRGRIEPFPNIFLFELDAGSRSGRSVMATHTVLGQHPAVVWTSKQRPLTRVKRDVQFSDPYFPRQWHLVSICTLASYPVPRPAFRRLQYGTASDEKLGVGLGTRLHVPRSWCTVSLMSPIASFPGSPSLVSRPPSEPLWGMRLCQQ